MSRWRLMLSTLLAAFLLGVASGCGGGGDGAVELRWQSRDRGAEALVGRGDDAAFPTVVYVSNETDATIRNARLRFRPSETPNAPLGFSVGTVTSVPTVFEGASHLWPVGDLAPGARVAFPLGLWFDAGMGSGGEDSLVLTLELVSPDLSVAVASNPLTVRLQP